MNYDAWNERQNSFAVINITCAGYYVPFRNAPSPSLIQRELGRGLLAAVSRDGLPAPPATGATPAGKAFLPGIVTDLNNPQRDKAEKIMQACLTSDKGQTDWGGNPGPDVTVVGGLSSLILRTTHNIAGPLRRVRRRGDRVPTPGTTAFRTDALITNPTGLLTSSGGGGSETGG